MTFLGEDGLNINVGSSERRQKEHIWEDSMLPEKRPCLSVLKQTWLELTVRPKKKNIYVPSFNGILEIFAASLALGIFKSIMAAREYFKTGLNYVLRGWKQWFNIQSTTHSEVNEHLEQLNVFRFPPLFNEFTYAEAFCVHYAEWVSEWGGSD